MKITLVISSIQDMLVKFTANIDEWTYQSAGALKSTFYIGKRGMYSGGGYTFELKPNESSRSTLVNLTNMSWIDEMTRVQDLL
jgi:hypothetical protein